MPPSRPQAAVPSHLPTACPPPRQHLSVLLETRASELPCLLIPRAGAVWSAVWCSFSSTPGSRREAVWAAGCCAGLLRAGFRRPLAGRVSVTQRAAGAPRRVAGEGPLAAGCENAPKSTADLRPTHSENAEIASKVKVLWGRRVAWPSDHSGLLTRCSPCGGLSPHEP